MTDKNETAELQGAAGEIRETKDMGDCANKNNETKEETETLVPKSEDECTQWEETTPKQAEDENVEWDGTESELVEDEDAEEYEEHYSGVKLNYVLKREEIGSCLKHTGFYKSGGTRQVIEICLLAVLAIMFFIMYSLTHATVNMVFGVISLFVIGLVLLIPVISLGVNIKKITTGKQLKVEIYPDNIEVYSGESKWEIPMDGSSQFEEYNKMFLVYMPQERIFIIPIRAVEPDFLADVQAMIVAGTTPKSED